MLVVSILVCIRHHRRHPVGCKLVALHSDELHVRIVDITAVLRCDAPQLQHSFPWLLTAVTTIQLGSVQF